MKSITKRVLAFLLAVMMIVPTVVGSIGTLEVEAASMTGSKTLTEYFGISRTDLVNWLEKHEHDDYYLGTPYPSNTVIYNYNEDWYNPKGDKTASGMSRNPVSMAPLMNCTGFVWHALVKAGASYSKIPRVASSGPYYAWNGSSTGRSTWAQLRDQYNLTRYVFRGSTAVQDMLASGVLEKGDILWNDGDVSDQHVLIFWGDTSDEDLAWHSGHKGNVISNIQSKDGTPRGTWTVLKWDTTGYLSVTKEATTNMFSEFTNVYSLEGAEYGIYSDRSCSADKLVNTITCDVDGVFSTVELSAGKYYLKETKAPKGYSLSGSVKEVSVTSGNTTTVKVQDCPQGDPVPVLLGKLNAETDKSTTWGDVATLAGAEYTYNYYAYTKEQYQAMSEAERAALTPDRTWVFKTDERGFVAAAYSNAEDYLVSGELFKDPTNGNIVYPVGSYTVQETKAPKGFLLNDTVSTVYITYDNEAISNEGDSIGIISTYNQADEALDLIEHPIRGDMRFRKVDAETKLPMAGITFDLALLGENDEEEEVVHIVTDGNGCFSTEASVNPHTQDTNGGNPESGIWFGAGSDPDDEEGALPYGRYRLTETPCEGNEGKDLVVINFQIYRRDEVIDLGDIDNKTISIGTTAVDKDTKSKSIPTTGTTTITDTVAYENLTPGRTYTLIATLMDKETGAEFTSNGQVVTNTVDFTPNKTSATVDVDLTFDASLLSESTSLVVFEKLVDRGSERAAHEEIEDEGQSIYVGDIHTTATDANTTDHVGTASKTVTINDVVEYTNLVDGLTYKVKGTLMDKETGEPLLDSKGNVITSEKEFTANGANGSVTVTFTFQAEVKNKTIVAFETLYYKGQELIVHADIDDEDQTVYYPEIHTNAYDGTLEDEDHLGIVDGKATIKDEVSYENLIVGQTYTVSGVLMNQETGESVKDQFGVEITASETFECTESTGTITLTYELDSYLVAGSTVVVFEDLIHKGVKVTSHADIADEAQSVIYPAVHTTATNKDDGSKTLAANSKVTIVDTVEYENLVPGKTYKMVGRLINATLGQEVYVDKSGKIVTMPTDAEEEDGEEGEEGEDTATAKLLTVEKTFTPSEPNGTIELEFEISTEGIDGVSLVVFESLYYGDVKIGGHEEISDEGQTVRVPELRTKARDKKNNSQIGSNMKSEVIIDTVSYTGLTPGKEYTVTGVLMDKSTGKALLVDGKEVTTEQKFVPDKESGTFDMTFTVDSSNLYGKTIVVFESMYVDKKLICAHADLSDKDQSITYGGKPSKNVKTGYDNWMFMTIFMVIVFLLIPVAFLLVFKWRKSKLS